MTNQQAFRRAVKAMTRAWEESDAFDHGGMASHEVLDTIEDALREGFKQPPRTQTPEGEE